MIFSVLHLAIFLVIFSVFILGENILKTKYYKTIGGFVLLVALIMISYRNESFPDTSVYINMYLNGENDAYYYFEVGNTILFKVIKWIAKNNYHILFAAYFLLSIGCIAYSVKSIIKYEEIEGSLPENKTNWYSFFILYMGYVGFLYQGVVMRQGLAMAILFVVFSLGIRKKKISAFLFLLLAISIHKIAILGIIILIISIYDFHIKKIVYWIWWFIIIGIWISRIGNYILSFITLFASKTASYSGITERLNYYLQNLELQNGFLSFKNIFFLFIGGYMLMMFIDSEVYRKCVSIYFTGLTLTFLINSFILSYRITDMFVMFFPLAVFLINHKRRMVNLDQFLFNTINFFIAIIEIIFVVRHIS